VTPLSGSRLQSREHDFVPAQNITLIVHYFPPINSSGARRMLAMAKYFARSGRRVTVITTTKGPGDGAFSEPFPPGVDVLELSPSGRMQTSQSTMRTEPQRVDGSRRGLRKIKDVVMSLFGQLPDPRLPFALSFLRQRLPSSVQKALESADIIVATTPPWPPLLAAIIAKRRFRKPIVLDYRDQFSRCHEMPGGKLAKQFEEVVDRWLCRQADALVSISPPMATYYSAFHKQSAVILNGYDHEPLEAAQAKQIASRTRRGNGPVIIRYLGLVSPGRIPYAMLAALDKLLEQGKIDSQDVNIEYYGDVGLLQSFLRERYERLLPMFRFAPQVPYDQALELIVTADHVLFCENAVPAQSGEALSAQGILTTKLFEYLASGRPIIAHISRKTLAGSYIERASADHFLSESEEEFQQFLTSDRFQRPTAVAKNDFVNGLSRASQAGDYLRLLDSVAAGSGVPQDLMLEANA
jgi:glycosyltransferase involved in cell wall biosynthesis